MASEESSGILLESKTSMAMARRREQRELWLCVERECDRRAKAGERQAGIAVATGADSEEAGGCRGSKE